MHFYTIKASKIKFYAVLLCSVAVLFSLTAIFPITENYDNVAAVATDYGGIKTNDDRVGFLNSFGYKVNTEPSEIVEVVVPESFDSVYESYNELQRAQGLNLKKYSGKKLTRYTYELVDYDNSKRTVYANLLVYKNKIVGGDICSLEGEGFIHGFTRPEQTKDSITKDNGATVDNNSSEENSNRE